jgi:DNA invertase Pin-like site-specific DNA recombinase
LADTTTAHGKLMITILGGLAEFERSLMKARTDVGIRRAREAGIRFGRPPKLTKHQQEQALKLLDAGEPQRRCALAQLPSVDDQPVSPARALARLLSSAHPALGVRWAAKGGFGIFRLLVDGTEGSGFRGGGGSIAGKS